MRLPVALMLVMVGISTDGLAQSLTIPELVERTRPEPDAPARCDRANGMPIVVTMWGGKIVVNGVHVVVQDLNVRPLEPGDEVVLFLEKAATPDRYRIVGEIGGLFGVVDQRVQSLLGPGFYKDVDGRSIADLARTVSAVNAPR